jgi:hypothetical protein
MIYQMKKVSLAKDHPRYHLEEKTIVLFRKEIYFLLIQNLVQKGAKELWLNAQT